MSGTMIPVADKQHTERSDRSDPRSATFRVAAPREIFDETDDVAGFVEGALDEHLTVPVSEGTVQLRRFESPLLEPVPSVPPSSPPAATSAQPSAMPPSWLMQLADVVPARHEKAVVAAILFFFLLGVLSFLAGVTILLFVL